MTRRNKPAQRVTRSCDLTTNTLDDWLEPCPTSDNDVVVCSYANCGKVSSSSVQLDVLQGDHSSNYPSSKSRYNPLPFIVNSHNDQHRQCNDNSCSKPAAAVVVDCKEDEQYIAYGKGDHQQQAHSTSQSTKSVMGVSSSLPAIDCPGHNNNERSCDPITIIDQENIPNSLDRAMSSDNSSDHVTSGDSSDPTTISSIKRKRRKLISSKGSVSNWQPTPIDIEEETNAVVVANKVSEDRGKSKLTSSMSDTSVKSAKRFYGRSGSFLSFKNKPMTQTLFGTQNRLKGYKIPHKSQSSQHTEVTTIDNDKNKTHSSLIDALSQTGQSNNAGTSSNSSSSKYFGGMETSLTRPSINRQQQHHVGSQGAMLNSVHLDCSKANVGSLTGIAEGATLSVDSLTFQLDDGYTQHLIVINPMINTVENCKINLQRQPYVMQLLLFSGPARQLSNRLQLTHKMYDPESSDDHIKYIQLLFDLKPSSESCEAINKVLDKIREKSTIGWTIERDTISSDEVYHPPTPASGRHISEKLPLKRYATRSKAVMKSPPLQAIKDNYTISDDEDDDTGDHKVDDDGDDDFESIIHTAKTFRRSTRSSSVTRIKPEDDKLLLSYRPGTLARAVSIFLSDLECLHEGEFLNDKIIDFYLKYLWYDKLPDDSSRNRVHVFSPFFYTRLVNSSFGGGKKGNQYDAELLHSRVKNWTKNVDLFSKELVILPVCQSSHWYVAVICHAGLFEATSSTTSLLDTSVVVIGSESSGDVISDVLDDTSSATGGAHSSSVTVQTDCHDDRNVVNKALRPCILMLDSLGGGHRTPTITKIRRYLTAEWKHKHNDKGEKDFSTFKVLSQNKLKAPLQENSSDCGLFVLQYVETLLQRVIIENGAIPETTDGWFTLADISKKRNDLHELITTLSTLTDIT